MKKIKKKFASMEATGETENGDGIEMQKLYVADDPSPRTPISKSRKKAGIELEVQGLDIEAIRNSAHLRDELNTSMDTSPNGSFDTDAPLMGKHRRDVEEYNLDDDDDEESRFDWKAKPRRSILRQSTGSMSADDGNEDRQRDGSLRRSVSFCEELEKIKFIPPRENKMEFSIQLWAPILFVMVIVIAVLIIIVLLLTHVV